MKHVIETLVGKIDECVGRSVYLTQEGKRGRACMIDKVISACNHADDGPVMLKLKVKLNKSNDVSIPTFTEVSRLLETGP